VLGTMEQYIFSTVRKTTEVVGGLMYCISSFRCDDCFRLNRLFVAKVVAYNVMRG